MAITKSAKKAHRQSIKKAAINEKRSRVLKSTVKDIKVLIVKKDKKSSTDMLKMTYKAIDKAAKRGVIKKGAANRKKSRLAKAIAKIA
jgi:small subunit ribosomal protein S20